MPISSIPLNLNEDNTGLGDVLITDAKLLIRPAVPDQYPPSVLHDSGHAFGVLSIANDMDRFECHIVTELDPLRAHLSLDRMFYAYVDVCCTELWCDARVAFNVDGRPVRVDRYGFDDGSYTLRIYVHCNVTDVEALIAKQLEDTTSDRPLIIVRPDDSPAGYTAAKCFVEDTPTILTDPIDLGGGYGIHDEDLFADSSQEEDEDPLAGDVDPTGGHYEAPLHPFDAHRLEVMRQHGDYTG